MGVSAIEYSCAHGAQINFEDFEFVIFLYLKSKSDGRGILVYTLNVLDPMYNVYSICTNKNVNTETGLKQSNLSYMYCNPVLSVSCELVQNLALHRRECKWDTC